MSCGDNPSYLGCVKLHNELQLFYVCANDVCGYHLSVPQIVRKRHVIKCLCERQCLYHNGVYSCAKVNGGCGVLFHENDSLTFMHTAIVKEREQLTIYPPRICHHRGVIKYTFSKLSMQGKLLYRRRVANDCLLAKDMHLNDCTIPLVVLF